MTDFVFFTVSGHFQVLGDDSTDVGGDPDLLPITGLVTFTPQVTVADSDTLTPPTRVLLRPVRGRIEEDGSLRTLDSAPVYYKDGETRRLPSEGLRPVFVMESFPPGNPAYWADAEGTPEANPAGNPVYGVRLVANSEAIGLPELRYRVDFSHVVFDGAGNRQVPPFEFTAPTSDVELDLVELSQS